MSRVHQAALIVVVTTSIACVADRPPTAPTPPAPTPPASPVLRGTVLNFQTQAPVAGVKVRISSDPIPFDAFGRDTVTDANGTYSFPMTGPLSGLYFYSLDNKTVGWGLPRGSEYRGDLMLNTNVNCVARYGVTIDRNTSQPIEGARISSSAFGSVAVMTQRDGWYLIYWGCPDSGTIGFNTTFLYASHPNYVNYEQVIGRGIQGMERVDFLLDVAAP